MDAVAEPAAGIRNPVLRVLVYGHVWLALGAAAQVWWMQAMLSGSVTSSGVDKWRAPVLAFCGTMVLYSFMRLVRMNHPDLQASAHMQWCRQNRAAIVVVLLTSGAIGTVLAMPFAVQLFRSLWPAALIAVLYVTPIGVAKGKAIGLRRLPGMKAILIAFTWASATVLLPAAMSMHGSANASVTELCVLQTTFFLSIALAFDVRDARFDAPSLRTMPQLVGARATVVIGALLMLPWIASLTLMALLSLDPIESVTPKGFLVLPMGLPAIGYMVAAGLILRTTPERSTTYFGIALDGMLILVPVLGWIGGFF